jgi:hypothetical protein
MASLVPSVVSAILIAVGVCWLTHSYQTSMTPSQLADFASHYDQAGNRLAN